MTTRTNVVLKVLGLALAVVCNMGQAQTAMPRPGESGEPQQPSAAAPLPAVVSPVSAVEPVFAFAEEEAPASAELPDYCYSTGGKTLPPGAIVVVVKRVTCTMRHSRSTTPFFLVYFKGKLLHVPEANINFPTGKAERFNGLTEEQTAASMEQWRVSSIEATHFQLKRALDALKATEKHGLALVKSSVFDISEHTEGTGYRVEVLNTGKKTIKYITFTVVGLNAVNDPVRDRLKGGPGMTLRGIGPIEPNEAGAYSKDYMWMTDVVQSHRVTQIRLEYIDGTTKVLTDIKSLRLRPEDYAFLTADLD